MFCEVLYELVVDGVECEFVLVCFVVCVWYVVEDLVDFCCGEV